MNNAQLNYFADLILNHLHSKQNEGKTRAEQMELIKPILIQLATEQRGIGRQQVVNHLSDELKKF